MIDFNAHHKYHYESKLTKDGLVTFKVYEDINFRYTFFTLNKNNEIICILGQKQNSIDWDNNSIMYSFEHAYRMSKIYQRKEVFNKSSQEINIVGKKYYFRFLRGTRNKVEVIGDKIYIHLKNETHRNRMIDEAFKTVADMYVKKRVKYWSIKMGAVCKAIYYKPIRWCFAYYTFSEKSITFSFLSLTYDKKIFDYLIIHELAHYFYQNHKNEFWKKVGEFCPNYGKYDWLLVSYK